MALDTRAAAARALAQVMAGKSLNQALPPAMSAVAAKDKSLLQQLCYGSLRQAPRLSGVLRQLLEKPLKEKDRDIEALLLCGLYQLDDTRIPDHAAVSATVAATRTLKKPWARGLTNAVLRRFLREKDTLTGQLEEHEQWAHPAWLYDALGRQWPAQREQILVANNSQPPMTVRVNSARITRDAYLAQLQQASIEAHSGNLSPQAIYLKTPTDVNALPGFAAGLVSVQDEAAQLAGLLLDAQPGDQVLDACAAPGGKACHILELQPELTGLIAADVNAARLVRVGENLQRLGLIAEQRVIDATAPPAELANTIDRILVDAPCSASGVIRRHPDVKLLRRSSDLNSLGDQQLQILQGLWPLLREGGHLLYATCSIMNEENDAVISRFLQRQPDASVLEIDSKPSPGIKMQWGRQLLPEAQGTDGLYYSLLKKA